MKTTEQKIKETEDKLKELKAKKVAEEDSKGWLDIPELKISVEIEVHNKNRSWNDLGLSEKEDQLLTSEQCVWLANSKYAKQLKMDGSSTKDDFFIKQPFNLNKKKGYVARFGAYSDYCVLYCSWDSGGSYSYLGVRFVKKISRSNK